VLIAVLNCKPRNKAQCTRIAKSYYEGVSTAHDLQLFNTPYLFIYLIKIRTALITLIIIIIIIIIYEGWNFNFETCIYFVSVVNK